MADAYLGYECRFQWDILNPSVPWQKMDKTFYHCSPTLKQWKVTLQPRDRKLLGWCDWPFTFSLQWVQSGDSDDILVADSIEVYLVLNKGRERKMQELNYSFHRVNRHSFKFVMNIRFLPTKKIDHLAITVDIRIPLIDEQQLVHDYGLLEFSEHLMHLLTHPLYSDLRLKSTDPLSNFPVHSYILHARWSNFFREHPVHTIVDDTVETNISNDLLSEILTYVYSGILDEDKKYPPELFQVIRKYELQHLYENFVTKDSLQEQRTVKNVYTGTFSFAVNVGRILRRTWHITPYTGNCETRFRIEFLLNKARLSFSYTLESMSKDRIYGRVNLMFVRRGGGQGKRITIDDRDYTIGANETVQSGTQNFDSKVFIRSGEEIRYSVKCHLYLSDGTETDEFETKYDGELLDDTERFDVLGAHLSKLLEERTGADLRVVCRAENPNNPDEINLVHKAIFATRIPNWRAVLQNVPEENDIPDEVTCILSSEAFRLVIDFIYRGKMFSIPNRFYDEIENFAELGGMTYWKQYVRIFNHYLSINEDFPRPRF